MYLNGPLLYFKRLQPTKVFAIAGGDGRTIGSNNFNQLQFGGDGMLLGYYLLPSTVVFQSAFVSGLTFNECPAIANTCSLHAIV